MRKYQSKERPWAEVARDLAVNLNAWKEQASVLSINSGVGYQAIRRMMCGALHNKTENALRLCKHFQISLEISDKVIISEEEKVLQAFREAWSGTSKHTELIIALIKCTRNSMTDLSNEQN